MKKTETTLIGAATPEQIEAWKKQYKKVYSIEVDGHVCYLRPLDRKLLSLIMTLSAANPMEGNEAIITNNWIGGSEEIKADEELYSLAILRVGEMVNTQSAVLKKL